MRLIAFTARCQREELQAQYFKHNVRCFDLHIRFEGHHKPIVVHGPIEYEYSINELTFDLYSLNKMGDVSVRVLLDVRREKDYTQEQIDEFWEFCHDVEMYNPNIKFWCGRNLYNWDINYNFLNRPTCEERYGSVTKPKWFWGWWPWLYARLHNKRNIGKGTGKDILLIDYVDIC